MIPNLSNTTKNLIHQRDTLRSNSPTDPHISTLDDQITQDIRDTNRQTWIHTVESCSNKYNTSQFFSLLRTLSGKRTPTPPNRPITFNNRTLTRNQDIAIAFNKQFSSTITHTSDPTARRVKRRLNRMRPLDTTAAPFTPLYTSRAIRNSGNSRAAGPDGLTIHHLKHLGPIGILFLTHLFNLSYSKSDIPTIWKSAIVVPLPKPNKPVGLGTSYRPISLLCPAAKVLERLLLPELNSYLPLASTQHGYRSGRSTTTALLPLVHLVTRGFNHILPPLRTVTVSTDLSKAFDTVNHTKLISLLIDTPLADNTVRWLSAYLKGRMASCRYNYTTSPQRHTRAGVPQGSCISPVLFNFFVSTYPHSTHLTTSYADDFTDSASSTDYTSAAAALSEHANRVSLWAADLGLTLSAPKSTVTLFTPDTRQFHHHPHVTINNTPLPLAQYPRILGVTLDPRFNFGHHIKNIISRASPRINILRALAGTTWGASKETILLTFKSLIQSLFTYATPIWFPNASPSAIAKLQIVQKHALRNVLPLAA